MQRFALTATVLLLAGCGLIDTATTAATTGVSQAQQLEQAKQVQQRLMQQLDQAADVAAANRERAEAATR